MSKFDAETKEILENFNSENLEDYPRASIHGRQDLLMITCNGEICYDPKKNLFVVFDETYVYTLGETPYPLIAAAILDSYSKNYL